MIEMFIKIPGPQFLLMFAGLSLVCILTAWLWTNLPDDQTETDLSKQSKLDMLSVAFLRGGQNEVIQTALFDLWSRNMIRIRGNGSDKTISSVISPDMKISEGPIHRAIYVFAVEPKKTSDVFSDTQLKATVENHLKPISENLKRLHLLRNDDDCTISLLAFIAALILIVGTGGTKLALGIMHRKPVGFLVVLLIISVIALFKAVQPGLTKPTGLGLRYLNLLKKKYYGLKKRIENNKLPADMNPAFAIAIFGTSILAGSQHYKPFWDNFPHNESSGGGGCGGGGCGGGCGGCGGD